MMPKEGCLKFAQTMQHTMLAQSWEVWNTLQEKYPLISTYISLKREFEYMITSIVWYEIIGIMLKFNYIVELIMLDSSMINQWLGLVYLLLTFYGSNVANELFNLLFNTTWSGKALKSKLQCVKSLSWCTSQVQSSFHPLFSSQKNCEDKSL